MTHNKIKKIFADLLKPIYLISISILMIKHPVLGWALFYIPIIYYLFFKNNAIERIKKHPLTTFFSTGILFYVCRIVAQKILNFQFEIMPEYLPYSSTILGAIYTTLSFGVGLSIWYSICLYRDWIGQILQDVIETHEHFAKTNYISKTKFGQQIQNYKSTKLFMPFLSLIGGVIILVILFVATGKITPYILLADTYTYSNCNTTKSTQGIYIQKNKTQCYQITDLYPEFIYVTKRLDQSN